MRAVSLMLVLCLAPLRAGAAETGAAAAESTGAVADGASAPARPAAKPGARLAKGKSRSKGKGESDGPGAVPRTGPRPGKPPRPVMARRPAPGPRAKAEAPVAHLLRSGFRVTSTGSEVVLQTSSEVDLETRGTRAAPSFVLRRCRALRANDRRSLDTRYFATSVTSVALRQRGRDLVVHVTLREPATATPRKEQGPGETWSWIVAFAASKETEPRSDPPSPSAPTATAAIVR